MQVYLEPYGRPARERLQALVAEAKAGNPFAPVTVVPPNAYAGIGLRRVLAGDGGLLNVGFMALARLAEQLGAPTMASQRRRPLSAASEMAVIRTVAMEVVGKEPLGSVAGHSTLHQSLQAAFKEVVRLSDSELDTLAGEGPLRQATVELYRRFRERTVEYYGPEDEAWAAAEAVRSGRGQPALQDVGALVFFLLTRPSPGETALLTALSDAVPCSLVVGRTGEAGVDDAEGAWWERLSEASADGSAELDARPESIVSAPDAREEVRQAVRDMLQRAEAGVPFHRMAALYRQQDPYAFQLRMELGFAGIPVAGPDPSPLQDSVPGRLLTGMLDVIREDFGRAALMRWLADAPVWNAASNRSASSELQRWEGLSREAGAVRGLEQWKERLHGLTASVARRRRGAEARGDLTEAQVRGYVEAIASTERLLALVEQLAQVKPPADGSPWSAFAKWAKDAIDRYGQGKNDWPAQQQDALGRVESALEELSKLDAVEPATTLAGFQQALDHALSAYMGRSGATGTGVFVAGLGAATGMEFDTVWLLGMSEGDYPARSGEDPLLPEYVRAQVLKGALPLRREAQLRERRDYLAALAGGERRRLSYSRVDPVMRRPQYPSPWLLEAASTLAGERVSSERLHTYDAPWLTVHRINGGRAAAGGGWTRRRRPRVRRVGPCAVAEDGIAPALAPTGLGRRPSGPGARDGPGTRNERANRVGRLRWRDRGQQRAARRIALAGHVADAVGGVGHLPIPPLPGQRAQPVSMGNAGRRADHLPAGTGQPGPRHLGAIHQGGDGRRGPLASRGLDTLAAGTAPGDRPRGVPGGRAKGRDGAPRVVGGGAGGHPAGPGEVPG